MNDMRTRSKVMTRTLQAMTVVLSQGMFSACADDSTAASHEMLGDQDPLAQYLVAEVKLPDYSLRMYETEPGSLLEVEFGRAAAERAAVSPDLDPVRRFEALSGERAPQALIAAAARAHSQEAIEEAAHDAVHEEAPIPVSSRPIANAADKANGAVDWGWFYDNYCKKTDSFYGGPNIWDGATWIRNVRVKYMKGGAYSHNNTIQYKMTYAGSGLPGHWFELPRGHFAGFRETSVIKRDASSNTTAVEWGDNYAHCVNYHD